MAFEQAATNAFTFSTVSPTSSVYNDALKTLIYQSATPWAVDSSRLLTDYVQGEFLTVNRLNQSIPQLRLDLDLSILLDPFTQRHSQSLLVILKYANQVLGYDGDWSRAAKYFTPALFDSRIGATLVPAQLIGNSSDMAVLRDAIAYSVIDEGARIFGDTAIRALFDDAGDLGKVLAFANASRTVIQAGDSLGSILTQFAGQLAIGKVLQSVNPEVLQGVLALSADQQTLAVDFSDELWSVGRQSNSSLNIIGRNDLIDEVIGNLSSGGAGQPLSNELRGGMQWLWNTSDTSIFDRFVFATQDDALTTTLPGPSYSSSKVTLFAASGSGDSVTGSQDNDFIYGGNGDDTLSGGAGDNLLAGGTGDDTFIVGQGREFFDGGWGNDKISYANSNSGVQLTIAAVADLANAGAPELELSASGGVVDRASSVENVELTDAKDTVHVGSDLNTLTAHVKIDGRSQGSGERDVLDFSAWTSKVDLAQQANGDLYVSGGTVYDIFVQPTVTYANFEEVVLSKNDDHVVIKTGVQQLYAGDGNDEIEASARGMTVDLGNGNDSLKGAGDGTIVYTGDGADKVEISHHGQMLIEDASSVDRLTAYFGLTLHGGVSLGKEGVYAYGLYGERYSHNKQGQLIIELGEGQTFVNNFNFALKGERTAGIKVVKIELKVEGFDAWTGPFQSLISAFKALEAVGEALFGWPSSGDRDPLVLDLNGNGIELSGEANSGVSFDLDKDGFAEGTGWVRNGDGILVRDLNGNGKIDDVGEMFGNATTTGFAALSTLDGNADGKVSALDNGLADFNGDGVVDANDTVDALKIWVDANENGVTDAGELRSLSSLDIVALSVNATDTTSTVSGNVIRGTSTFERGDGTSGTIGNVGFTTDEMNTKWNGDSSVSAREPVRERFPDFAQLLATVDDAAFERLRAAESVGRPLGDDGFLDRIERATGRQLRPGRRGPRMQSGFEEELSALSP